MGKEDIEKLEAKQEAKQIRFHYIKSNYFRVIHADGIIGGITPHKTLHISFFNERVPIPQQEVYEIKVDGTLGSELKEERVSKKGVVRETEVDIILSFDVARALSKWLEDRIKDLEHLPSSKPKS